MSTEPIESTTDEAPAVAVPTIDYASPLNAPPRPTVALWVAAGIVWAGCLFFLAAAVFSAILASRQAGGKPPPAAPLVTVGLLLAALAWVEWRAVGRRSRRGALGIFYLTLSYGVVVAGGIAWGVVEVIGSGRVTTDDAIGFAAAFALLAAIALVAVTHRRWAARIGRPTGFASGEAA